MEGLSVVDDFGHELFADDDVDGLEVEVDDLVVGQVPQAVDQVQ